MPFKPEFYSGCFLNVRDRTESPFFFQQYALSSLVKKEIS